MSENTDRNMQIIENASSRDIRPGDYVIWKQTRRVGDITITGLREGIAHHRGDNWYWCTEKGKWLDAIKDETTTLTIHRAADA